MELSISDVRELLSGDTQHNGCSPWKVGSQYLIRTVTMIQAGRLVSVTDHEVVLKDAVWIADTGRFHDMLKDPSVINEIEPFLNDVIVGRGAIVDATEWQHPRLSQK